MRFLIVDDDAGYRELLRYYLEVRWPDSRIDQMQSSPGCSLGISDTALREYDTILLSYPLGEELGFERLRELRSRDGCPPVILFAANSNEYLAVDAIKAGAASFFPKLRLRYRRLIETIRVEMGWGQGGATGINFVQQSSLRYGGEYRFIETLHSTEITSVYLAKSLKDEARVVFKVLRHVPDSGGGHLFDRFIQEYELVASIDHPNVISIFDLGVADDHAFIAMEYLSEGSLARRLSEPLVPGQALNYVRQIASALQAIHEAGVLHRDLKPANIMFRPDDTLALIDFGLAKQVELEADITGAGRIFGTPHYMSPEQGHGQPVDARSDIYSLGCILYEMLVGRRPFSAGTAMGVIYQQLHAPRPELPRELEVFAPVLGRMFAKDPAERYPTTAELLVDLDAMAPRA
jgi:serine/threonine protein kinase